MDDTSCEGGALREMIVESVARCTDLSLLDLVYKILVCDM